MTQPSAEGVEGGQHGGRRRGTRAISRPGVQARRWRGMDLHNVGARVNRLNVPDGEIPAEDPVHRQVPGHEERYDESDGVDHQAAKGVAYNLEGTHVTAHDRGAVVHAPSLQSLGVEASRVDQTNGRARVDVDVA